MPSRAGQNRVFTNMVQLRRMAEALIEQSRYRITSHARIEHPEFDDEARLAIVQWGGRDRPDRNRPASDGAYVCWANHPRHGECRAVYAVEGTPAGDILVIISVMPEE